MIIQVFQSDKGDCLLLTGDDGKRILVDGGMPSSYNEHVAPALHKIHKAGEQLDVVYVSHVDADHIAGILKMTDDLVAWKVFDFQTASGNNDFRKPDEIRPPEFRQIWNNAFHEQLGKNAGPIESMLAAHARALSLIPREFAQDAAEEYANIAQSKGEAVRLSRRLGAKQLNVPVNPEYDGGLMYVAEPPDEIKVGGLTFTVIGPFDEDLKNLRDEWNEWLRSAAGKKQLAGIRKRSKEDEDLLGSAEMADVLGPVLGLAQVLGDRDKVTLPNLASLMMFVKEQGGATMLLTGDGHWKDILEGLEITGKLTRGKGLHVNVLKVQHHGSEHNWHHDFGREVTADHYVFCGNGAHTNPELSVIEAILDSRLSNSHHRANTPQVGNKFKLWFNCASSIAQPKHVAHMKKIEKLLEKTQRNHPTKVTSHFLEKSSFKLTI